MASGPYGLPGLAFRVRCEDRDPSMEVSCLRRVSSQGEPPTIFILILLSVWGLGKIDGRMGSRIMDSSGEL